MAATDTEGPPESFDLFLALRKRRMHREFGPDSVDDALLERLVYAAGRAPSARAGLRHLVVVTDPRLVRTLRQVCPGFLNNAPAAIAVCTDVALAEVVLGPVGAVQATLLDSGAAVGFLSLAAPALGLGICLTTSWSAEVVQEVLGLPPHIRPDALVAVGRPVASPRPAPRRFEPLVHRDRYEAPEGTAT